MKENDHLKVLIVWWRGWGFFCFGGGGKGEDKVRTNGGTTNTIDIERLLTLREK